MKLKSIFIENLPSIFTGIAITGVVETVILAVKATPKALDILEEHPEIEKKIDKAKITWKCYIPTATAGTVTLACIVGANYVHLKKEAGIIAAYSLLGNKFADYRERSGEKHDKKIINAIEKSYISEAIEGKPSDPVEIGKMWCYEPESKQYFRASTEQILWAQLTANQIFKDQGWLSFNQFLELLPEVNKVEWGDHTGWYTYDEDGYWDYNWSYYRGHSPWIDIKPQICESEDVMIIAYGMHPGDCPDPHDIEEPEQIKLKPVYKS